MENQNNQNLNTEQPIPKKIGIFFWEIAKVVILAGITVFFVRHFIFKPFYVKGQSMEPSFSEHDYLIVDQVSYRLREPKRGEVVVFHPPTGTKDYYLKRIVGLPNERVRIENGKVIVCKLSCEVLDEKYIDDTNFGKNSNYSITLGEDQYFVLGDNRDNSSDSRIFGPVDREAIVGKIWVRGYPLNRISVFDKPIYQGLKIN